MCKYTFGDSAMTEIITLVTNMNYHRIHIAIFQLHAQWLDGLHYTKTSVSVEN